MSDYPEAWVTAAAEALTAYCPNYENKGAACVTCKQQARAVLDAVAPTIRAEAETLLQKRTRDWLAHCKRLDAERDAVSDDLAKAWKELGEAEAERERLRDGIERLITHSVAVSYDNGEHRGHVIHRDRFRALLDREEAQ